MHLTDICSLLDVNFHRKKTLLWKFWQNRSTFLPIKWKIENSLSWIWIHSENRSNQQCSVIKQWSLKTGLKPIIEMRKNTNFFVTWFIILSACFIVSFFFRFFFFTGMPSEWRVWGVVNYIESDSFSWWNLGEVDVILIQGCCLLDFMVQYNEIDLLLLTF